jgi:hypothetical protein
MTDPQPDPQPDPVLHDLDLTTSALSGGPLDLGFANGVLEVERWQDRLDESDAPALQEIGAALAELRGEMESDAPDPQVLTDLLRRLAGMTDAVGREQPEGPVRTRLLELAALLDRGAAEAR